ncbi:hypothetical protein ABW20_dc0101260 [Dactylellina cionopaga]|nr:hypothetical protein ABW20_dc0101260 [Dactylellina cionopaga]
MSEQAITTMKSTVGYLLENLTGTLSDNFGITAFTSTSACEVLIPMVPCTHQAKHRVFSLLDQLRTASDPFLVETPISNVARAACSMFIPGVYGKNKNLIILSSVAPAHQENMVDLGGFEDVKVHVIGVGCVYWPVSEVIYADARDGGGGFCFPTAMMDVTTVEANDQLTKMQGITRRFVRAMRSGYSIGMMREVEMRISPGESAIIKATIGKTTLTTLRPGERATVMARMQVTSALRKQSSNSDDGELEALEEGLYATLGMETMKLVTVDIRYKHSALPATTTLNTSASADLTIITSDSLWSSASSSSLPHLEYDDMKSFVSSSSRLDLPFFTSPTPRQHFVRKALIQKVVSEHKYPKDALSAVEEIAKRTEEKDLDYCDVVRELKYQIKVWKSRRRGRVLGVTDDVISFVGTGGGGGEQDGLARAFNFQGGRRGDDYADGGMPALALTNDSYSIEESAGSPGSVRRFVEGVDETVDSSPITVIESEAVRRMSMPRPADSATRLWKRIERAVEVGSIGGSSVGTIEMVGGGDGDTEGGSVGGENSRKKKNKTKRKNRKKGKKEVESKEKVKESNGEGLKDT